MPDVIQGPGALDKAFAEVDGNGWVVLGGQSSFQASGAERILAGFLRSGAELHRVSGPLPTVRHADRLIEDLSGKDLIGLLAVGGGLVIDTMKVVSLGLASGMTARELLHDATEAPGAPIHTVAVPTTAGSGAERTPFAVVYADGVKQSIDDPRLLPQTAIVDPLLVRSAPKSVAAPAGLDALAHCIESLWARRSTPESQELAADALGVVAANLEPAIVARDIDALASLAFAASTAGAAIATTRTTAAHALSYHLTSVHGVPHGHAVALTLGTLMEFNANVDDSTVSDTRGVNHVHQSVDTVCQILGIKSASEGPAFVTDLIGRLGLSSVVDEAAGEHVDRELWVRSVNPERLSNNPRTLGESDLVAIVS